MTNRKIIVYPNSAMKPIILTDISNESLEEIQNRVTTVLGDNKISILNTANDSLIIRPSEIQAILITTKDTGFPNTKYSDSMESGKDGTPST